MKRIDAFHTSLGVNCDIFLNNINQLIFQMEKCCFLWDTNRIPNLHELRL
jgi:hypothetical protein